MALGVKRPGTHARFVALPETWLSRKPERLTMTQAAAVGRSYFVAWQTVINAMGLMPGETILITGGAGMVGQAATAIARWRGADPIVAGRRKPDGARAGFIRYSLAPLNCWSDDSAGNTERRGRRTARG
jgi:NADPH:quinone reductase-like Zn-dependent oxidoreductase